MIKSSTIWTTRYGQKLHYFYQWTTRPFYRLLITTPHAYGIDFLVGASNNKKMLFVIIWIESDAVGSLLV